MNESERGHLGVRKHIEYVRLGVQRAALPVCTTRRVGHHQCAQVPLPAAHDRRGKDRTQFVVGHELDRLGSELRCEVDQIVDRDALPLEGRRSGRERLCRRVPFLRDIAFLDRPLLDGPYRLPGRPIEHVDPPLFGGLRDSLDRAAIDGDVGEYRGAGDVPVPDVVVYELIVPDALAGLEIQRNQTRREKVGAGTMPPVIVAGGIFDRQIDTAPFLIDRDLSPDPGVARVRPRFLLPRVVPELTEHRDRVEDPQAFTRPHIVAANEPFLVSAALGRAATLRMR